MTDNKMQRVAEMFGKNLNETFYIKGFLSPFSFTELGLVSREQPFNISVIKSWRKTHRLACGMEVTSI